MINSNINYNTYNPLSGAYFAGGYYFNYAFNQFVSSLTYDSIGRTYSSFVNGNTLNYLGVYGYGGIPIIKQVLQIDPHIEYSYGNFYNYVDKQKNVLVKNSLETDIDISLYTDIVEFSFGVSYNFTKNTNSINSNSNLNNTTYGLNSDVKIILPWGMELSSDFDYNSYNNLSQNFNINAFIWNAKIKQNLGKNKNWTIPFEANDMLNQNTKINRSAFANRITDNRTMIISRYFMLNLAYRFNSSFKKKENQENTIDN